MKVSRLASVKVPRVSEDTPDEEAKDSRLGLRLVDISEFISRVGNKDAEKFFRDVLKIGSSVESILRGTPSSGFSSRDIVGCPHTLVGVDLRSQNLDFLGTFLDRKNAVDKGPSDHV